MASNWRKKGSVEAAEEESKGRRGNSSGRTPSEEATKSETWRASAAETTGVGVMKVTPQPREASAAASRRNGMRWPMPALVSRATWGAAAAAGGVMDPISECVEGGELCGRTGRLGRDAAGGDTSLPFEAPGGGDLTDPPITTWDPCRPYFHNMISFVAIFF
ncbi:unnamed protein product [Spirodela intermedia]|uniref:Uncharacterized protein n=1 Tax=Spirodela intermedia TaxID=51605 RepID=A0A7I8JRP0_SPIIN|nr:unnamed protein product [Spirodela intermedia]CAA6672441.1 unnamed protein product [Spirodela intermedia]